MLGGGRKSTNIILPLRVCLSITMDDCLVHEFFP